MKKIIFLLLAGSGGLVWAQTNPLAQKLPEQQTEIGSDHFYFDDKTRQLVYSSHVWVTNSEGSLTCERLTIDLPPNGNEHPTNIVAETNVVVDALDEKGATNTITADKAIYTYNVANAVTNEIITFTNNGNVGSARIENPQFWQTGKSITWDCVAKKAHVDGNQVTHLKQIHGAGGTNASPFNFLK